MRKLFYSAITICIVACNNNSKDFEDGVEYNVDEPTPVNEFETDSFELSESNMITPTISKEFVTN